MELDQSQRGFSRVKGAISVLITRLRLFLGRLLQVVQQDELAELGEETRRLGAASVESSTYVSGELQAIEARLARLEEELAGLRRLLEERGQGGEAESPQHGDAVSGRQLS